MPTVGLFSQQYWNGNRHTNIVITPLGASGGGYPLWQSAVSVSVFGPPLDVLKGLWYRAKWSLAMLRVLWAVPVKDRDYVTHWLRYLPTVPREERYVLTQAQRLMTSTVWPMARAEVAKTATTLGFNEAKFWKALSTKAHADRGHAAQYYRHLQATDALRERFPLMSSHDLNFVIEAAYHAFTQQPKKTV